MLDITDYTTMYTETMIIEMPASEVHSVGVQCDFFAATPLRKLQHLEDVNEESL